LVDDEFGDKKLPYIYWGLQSSKNGESQKKKTGLNGMIEEF